MLAVPIPNYIFERRCARAIGYLSYECDAECLRSGPCGKCAQW